MVPSGSSLASSGSLAGGRAMAVSLSSKLTLHLVFARACRQFQDLVATQTLTFYPPRVISACLRFC
jgi:hypothetical protein